MEHQRPDGTLQPLDIPVWKWDSIAMDSVTHLPRTVRGHDAIWVVVDRLTKSAHFLAVNLRMSMAKLDIPVWKWDSIAMDFVTHLPRTVRGHDAIWVVVDRLTKSAHFLAVNLRMSMAKLAQLYSKEIVRLHGVPSSIVSDRDPRFISRLWQTLQDALGSRLRMVLPRHVKVSQPSSHGLAHHGPGQNISEPNLAHFKVSQIFYNAAQPTTGW